MLILSGSGLKSTLNTITMGQKACILDFLKKNKNLFASLIPVVRDVILVSDVTIVSKEENRSKICF